MSVCGESFYAPSAEELAFNSQGACSVCGGTGIVRTVDESTLVPDESLTIDQGAVAPWNSLMWSLMTDVCRAMGVRTDVPFRDLTDEEKEIVYHGPAVKKHIFYRAKNSDVATELDFTYYNAVYTVENALSKVKDESGMKRVEKFLRQDACPACGGSRLSEAARAPKVRGISLDEACRMTLSALDEWVKGVPESLPSEMRPMAESICASFGSVARRLMDLGLGYLTLDRAASTLSTGERQRMQLARAVRNRTTGVLYVLDEPSIGLHPSNIVGLVGVMRDLVADGQFRRAGRSRRADPVRRRSHHRDGPWRGGRRAGRSSHRDGGTAPPRSRLEDRPFSGNGRRGAPARADSARCALRFGEDLPFDQCHPYGETA